MYEHAGAQRKKVPMGGKDDYREVVYEREHGGDWEWSHH
jgi:hypothetical protein